MLFVKHLHIIEAWFVGGKPAKFKNNWLAKDSKKGDFQKTAWVFAIDDTPYHGTRGNVDLILSDRPAPR